MRVECGGVYLSEKAMTNGQFFIPAATTDVSISFKYTHPDLPFKMITVIPDRLKPGNISLQNLVTLLERRGLGLVSDGRKFKDKPPNPHYRHHFDFALHGIIRDDSLRKLAFLIASKAWDVRIAKDDGQRLPNSLPLVAGWAVPLLPTHRMLAIS